MNVYRITLVNNRNYSYSVSVKADNIEQVHAILKDPKERPWHRIPLTDYVRKIEQVY